MDSASACAIAKWILKAHHGRIWVTSEVEEAAHLPSLFQFPYQVNVTVSRPHR